MINKVILVGNVGADPEVRQISSGQSVASVSLATSRRWKDKQTGEKTEETEWHRVIFWGKLAEIVGEYLRKGSQIYVEGRISTRKWEDSSGIERYSTEIIASEMNMLGGKSDGSKVDSKPKQKASDATPNNGYPDDFDDDIPF